jgi:hypothetical protein
MYLYMNVFRKAFHKHSSDIYIYAATHATAAATHATELLQHTQLQHTQQLLQHTQLSAGGSQI